MCICLNCNYINICQQYFFIEKNHNELKSKDKNPFFNPTQSIININYDIKVKEILIELDLEECLSFKEKPGKWLINDDQ